MEVDAIVADLVSTYRLVVQLLYGCGLRKAECLNLRVQDLNFDAGITKRVTSHTFRHTFASHLLRANYDLRTIQQLLGHADIRTTMIYTHTVRSRTLKEAESPLDFPEALLDTLEGFAGGYVDGK